MTARSRPARHVNSSNLIEALERRRLLAATLPADVGAGALHANPSELTVAGGYLYYVAAGSSPGPATRWSVLRTDGTAAGTVHVPSLTPAGAGVGGSSVAMTSQDAGLAFYTGPRSLVAVDDALWFYEIAHTSSHVLVVKLNRFDADGTHTTLDLGEVNLSLRQTVHDLRNVDGRIYFFRDGEYWQEDPALQAGYWWTVD